MDLWERVHNAFQITSIQWKLEFSFFYRRISIADDQTLRMSFKRNIDNVRWFQREELSGRNCLQITADFLRNIYE